MFPSQLPHNVQLCSTVLMKICHYSKSLQVVEELVFSYSEPDSVRMNGCRLLNFKFLVMIICVFPTLHKYLTNRLRNNILHLFFGYLLNFITPPFCYITYILLLHKAI